MWKHKKYSVWFEGCYRYNDEERTFVLKGMLSNGTRRNISFESWQAAKSLGWVRANKIRK